MGTRRTRRRPPAGGVSLTRTDAGYRLDHGNGGWWEVEPDGAEWVFRYRSPTREHYGADAWTYVATLAEVRDFLTGRRVAAWARYDDSDTGHLWYRSLRRAAIDRDGAGVCPGRDLGFATGHSGCCDTLGLTWRDNPDGNPRHGTRKPYPADEVGRYVLYGRLWKEAT